MPTDDVRLTAWSLRASVGTTVRLEFTSPEALTSLSIYTGGTVEDVDDLTGAEAFDATLTGGDLIATVDLDVPTGDGVPLRLVIDGVVQAVGRLVPSRAGTPVPDNTIALTAGTLAYELTVLGVIIDEGGGGGGGAVRVEDEGATVITAASALNFAGAGVTVTDAGANEALVTISGDGGGGGEPSGPAGGVLGGTYPNPSFAADMATQAELNAEATLARNADNLTSGTVADARIASTIARDSEVTAAVSAAIVATITNGDTTHASSSDALFDALALKATAANPVFTGTVTVPDGALAIADTSGLQAALDAATEIGSLTGATALDGSELAVLEQGGDARQRSYDNILDDLGVVLDVGPQFLLNANISSTSAAAEGIRGISMGTAKTITFGSTAGFGGGNVFTGMFVGPTVVFDEPGAILAPSVSLFWNNVTVKNVNGEARAMGLGVGLYNGPTYTGDGAAVTATHLGLWDAPTLAIANAGTLTLATASGVKSSCGIGTGVTVTNRTGLLVDDATGAGTLTTQIGVDIAAMVKGASNIGIRNAAPYVATPLANTNITAVSATIRKDAETVTLTADASYTLTSAPTIADGVNGQRLRIINVDTTDVITLQDQGTLASSNLRLTTTTVALGPRDSIDLQYDSTVGDWVQVGSSSANVVLASGAGTTFTISDTTYVTIASVASIPVGRYLVKGFVPYWVNAAADMNLKFTNTGTMTMIWTGHSLTSGVVTGGTQQVQMRHRSITEVEQIGGQGAPATASDDLVAVPEGRLTVTATGTLNLQAAMQTDDGSDLNILAGSSLDLIYLTTAT